MGKTKKSQNLLHRTWIDLTLKNETLGLCSRVSWQTLPQPGDEGQARHSDIMLRACTPNTHQYDVMRMEVHLCGHLPKNA